MTYYYAHLNTLFVLLIFCSLFVILDQSHLVCKRLLYCRLCTGWFLILLLWNNTVSGYESRSKWLVVFITGGFWLFKGRHVIEVH